jgi:hypothetical protein
VRGAAGALAGLLEAGRRVGFGVLLVGGSAALGFAVAWPLWLFATARRGAFTVFTISLIGAGFAVIVARAILRRRTAARDTGKPWHAALATLLAWVAGIVFIVGAYLLAVLLARALWVLALPFFLLWGGVLWALGFLRRRAKRRKERPVPAETRSE